MTTVETKEIKITRMLLCVVLVFGVCYSFEFARRIFNYIDPKLDYPALINHLSSLFYVLNSAVNFIIYMLMVKKFRMKFCKMFSFRTRRNSKKNDATLNLNTDPIHSVGSSVYASTTTVVE